MSWPFGEDLQFEHYVFIPIKNAFAYLVDKNAVFELENLYYHYKGFALESEYDGHIYLKRESERVYLDAIGLILKTDVKRFWQIYPGTGALLNTQSFDLFVGTINGEAAYTYFNRQYDMSSSVATAPSVHCELFDLDSNYCVNLNNIYVNRDDLDEISDKYGIPKETFWDDNSFKIPTFKEKNDFENANAVIDVIDSRSSPQDSFIDFTKSVLIQNPDAKTADLRQSCFEDMGYLNSRDNTIFNDLLVKAGAIKSKQGKHAKDIEWEIKYPKVQWMRVFNKKK